MCARLIFSPQLRTKLSVLGFSLGFWFAWSLPPGLQPSPSFFAGLYLLSFACFCSTRALFSALLFLLLYYFLFLGFHMELALIEVG
jgi:hypothetical protein